MNSSEIKIGKTYPLTSQELNNIDQKSFALNYQGNSVQELANILSSLVTTEAEKARIIYAWITDNIAYDVEMLEKDIYWTDVTAKTVLKKRQTVCSGYSNLYQALAKAMGLDVVIIEGTATGASYVVGDSNINHAWNAVKIDDQWYLLDTTWGAGTVQQNQFRQQFNPYYFATPPEQLIFSHFPANVNWQLLEQPYTMEDFQEFPTVSPDFFKKQINFMSHETKVIMMETPTKILLSVPQDMIVTTRLKKNQQVLPDYYSLVQKQEETVTIKTAFPQLGKYKLEVFADSPQSQNYPHILTYNIKANYTSSPFPKTYPIFQDNTGYLYTPLNYQLPKNQRVNFKLKIQNATDIQIINTATNQWTQLTRFDQLFIGTAKVGNSPMKVVAQFPGDRRYWTLLEYN
ncbi:MAG: transglutaminase domain-containing protein [Halothece sp. Uz-M2-17]|nr:transglutaminase domain-containing protein [Halothece sp. Uz-M2-17]